MLLSNASYDITERLAGLMKVVCRLQVTPDHRVPPLLRLTPDDVLVALSQRQRSAPWSDDRGQHYRHAAEPLHEADSAAGFSIQRSEA
jgi:hypothetical protein